MRFPALFAAILRERAVCLGILGVCLGLMGAHMLGFSLWKCAFHEATGLPCPGCGLTRGMSALVRGQAHEAMAWHPFTPVFAIAALMIVTVSALPDERRMRAVDGIAKLERRTGFALLTLIALMIYGVWRMWRGPWI